jgi:SAM-dependent methyltransferase
LSESNGRFDGLTPGYEGVGEYYDLFADNSDIPFYLALADQQGSPILDLAAGTGRVAFPLAEAGHDVVALESSPSMIEVARRRLSSESDVIQERVELVQGDMTGFELDKLFRLVIVPNSFGHALTTESQLSTLECVHRHLSDDGIFVLDLFPGALQNEHVRFEDRPRDLPDGSSVSRVGEMYMNPVRQVMRLDLTYTVRDSTGDIVNEVDVTSGAAVIFNREADLLVRAAGLEKVREYGDFEKEPYQEHSSRRIMLLRRRYGWNLRGCVTTASRFS